MLGKEDFVASAAFDARLAADGKPFVLLGVDLTRDGKLYQAIAESWGLETRVEPNRRRAYFWKDNGKFTGK
jgi:hypothetical protein